MRRDLLIWPGDPYEDPHGYVRIWPGPGPAPWSVFEAMAAEAIPERTAPDPTPEGPIASWRAVAAACGVDEDTVHRWRERRGDTAAPVFADGDAARSWWRTIRHGVSEAPARRRPTRRTGPTQRGQGTTLADLEKGRE